MASTGSSGRAFWTGAGVGAAFSISLALALSLITPLEVDEPGAAGVESAVAATAADGLSDEDQSSGASFGGPATPPNEVAEEAPQAPETSPAPDVSAIGGGAERSAAAPEATTPDAPAAPSPSATAAPAEPEAAPSPADGAPLGDEPAPVDVAAAPASPAPSPEEGAAPSGAISDEASTEDDAAPEEAALTVAEPDVATPSAIPTASLTDFEIDGLPPFKAYAEGFEGDASEPFLSIVLLGVGRSAEDLDELLLLPGPLTVVLPPETEGLEDVIFDLRDAGFEVLLGLNAGAVSDGEAVAAEIAAARMDAMEETMGVAAIGAAMDEEDVAGAVVAAAESRGFALLDVSAPGGGAGYRLAQTRDLPTAPNGRRFDEIRTSAMVFQALERASIDARRDGVFVVTGETTKDVITGVRRWMNVKANKTINVAPLSVAIDKYGSE